MEREREKLLVDFNHLFISSVSYKSHAMFHWLYATTRKTQPASYKEKKNSSIGILWEIFREKYFFGCNWVVGSVRD